MASFSYSSSHYGFIFKMLHFHEKQKKEINGNNEKLVNLYDMYKNITPITYKED